MAAKKATGAESAEATDAPAKGGKKKLLLALPVLLVVGVAGYTMLGRGGEDKPKPPEPGEVVKVDPIHINLADGHYLKLGLALQATKEAHEPPEGSKALDIAISQFSNREVRELASNKAREHAKHVLVEKVSKAYHHEVMDVYFTEFVMQ